MPSYSPLLNDSEDTSENRSFLNLFNQIQSTDNTWMDPDGLMDFDGLQVTQTSVPRNRAVLLAM